jgi:hypothetical protein
VVQDGLRQRRSRRLRHVGRRPVAARALEDRSGRAVARGDLAPHAPARDGGRLRGRRPVARAERPRPRVQRHRPRARRLRHRVCRRRQPQPRRPRRKRRLRRAIPRRSVERPAAS